MFRSTENTDILSRTINGKVNWRMGPTAHHLRSIIRAHLVAGGIGFHFLIPVALACGSPPP